MKREMRKSRLWYSKLPIVSTNTKQRFNRKYSAKVYG
jgi:hypothetical protein